MRTALEESQAAEIARLRADNKILSADFRTQNKCVADQHDELAALRAELAAVKRDASVFRTTLSNLFNALQLRHYGRMPDDVQIAFDAAREVLKEPKA